MEKWPEIKRAEKYCDCPYVPCKNGDVYSIGGIEEERRNRAEFYKVLVKEIDDFIVKCEERRRENAGWGFACEVPKIWRDKLLEEAGLDSK